MSAADGLSVGPVPRDLGGFSGRGYEVGRCKVVQVAWLVSSTLIQRWWVPMNVRVGVLRLFGARIARNARIRHRVRIHWPWKLVVGENSWIGEGTWILNLEPVNVGSNACISQDVLLCTGSHDRTSVTFEFDNGPIVIGDGAWICARATVLRGVTVGNCSVVGAGSVVSRDVPERQVILGGRVL